VPQSDYIIVIRHRNSDKKMKFIVSTFSNVVYTQHFFFLIIMWTKVCLELHKSDLLLISVADTFCFILFGCHFVCQTNKTKKPDKIEAVSNVYRHFIDPVWFFRILCRSHWYKYSYGMHNFQLMNNPRLFQFWFLSSKKPHKMCV
jgi:hypothetical protein